MSLPAAPRARVLGRVADHLVALPAGHPVRVAVDGVTAAGKTTLADELAAAVAARDRPVVRLSMDGFHHPRAHRYRRGRDSAEGYYRDAYDVAALGRLVLDPLGPGGDRRYRTAVLDLATDRPVDAPERRAEPEAVLVVDGTFLQRPELDGRWDEVVFVDTALPVARERGVRRDVGKLGGPDATGRAFDDRYHAACRLYLAEVDPAARAGVVIGNDDLEHPALRRVGGPAGGTVRLFSYGTLRQPEVQRATFGRLVETVADTLPGHRAGWVRISDPSVVAASGSDRHPIVEHTGDPADVVPGSVLTLTTDELAAADLYEVDDYRRHQVRLASGTPAWTYLATTPVTTPTEP